LQQHLVFSSKNRTKKHFGETALNCAAFRGHEMVPLPACLLAPLPTVCGPAPPTGPAGL
jgi:hypothetical protein